MCKMAIYIWNSANNTKYLISLVIFVVIKFEIFSQSKGLSNTSNSELAVMYNKTSYLFAILSSIYMPNYMSYLKQYFIDNDDFKF